TAVASAGLVAGPGSPLPRRGGGGGGGGDGGGGLSTTPRSPPSAGKRSGGGSGSGGKHSLQSGLGQFFRQSARCLGCKQVLPRDCGGGGGDLASAPGLCGACLREPDTLPATHLRTLADDNTAFTQLASALATCLTCHSGGHAAGALLCENGECPQLFARLGAVRRLAASGERLERLDLC
ncbi:hypothetical protein Agub_g1149, partial [Astrephomene gubernaculifera]